MKKVFIVFITLLLLTGCGEETPEDILAKANPIVIQKYNDLFPDVKEKFYITIEYYRSSDYDADIEKNFKILKLFIETKHKDDPQYQEKLINVFASMIEQYKIDERAQAELGYAQYMEEVNEALKKAGIQPKPPNPKIGMTSDEVLASSWGKPQQKNITETVYGKSEQWVYDRGYIYLDNGIVTAIQTTE